MSETLPTIDDVLAAIRKARVRYATEAGLHMDVQKALVDAGIQATKEYRLSGKDRVDLAVKVAGGTLAIEMKVMGSLPEVDRQVARYAAHEEVVAVVVVSPLTRHSGLAREACQKPVHVIIRAEGAFL